MPPKWVPDCRQPLPFPCPNCKDDMEVYYRKFPRKDRALVYCCNCAYIWVDKVSAILSYAKRYFQALQRRYLPWSKEIWTEEAVLKMVTDY